LTLLSERWDDAVALNRKRRSDPATLSRLALECDIQPLLHGRLESSDRFDLIPAQVREELAAARHKCRMDNMLLLAEAEKAIDALAGAGVVPVVLKGMDIIHRYGMDFDLRRMDDMDFLVPTGQVRNTMAALAAAGWQLPDKIYDSNWAPYHTGLESAGPVTVYLEIHWNIVQEGRYRLDPAELFTRAGNLAIGDRQVLGLDIHDMAVHTLLHHVSSHFHRKLKNWVDLRLLSLEDRFDWKLVANRVREWGGLPGAAMSMRHAGRLFPDWFPRSVVRLFGPERLRSLGLKPLESDHPLDMYRKTDNRAVEMLLSAAMVSRPWRLPAAMRLFRGDPDYLKDVLDVSRHDP
jgi:hypothetical protein